MTTRPDAFGRMTDAEGRLLPNAWAHNTLSHRMCTSYNGDCRGQNKFGRGPGPRVAMCGREVRNQDLKANPPVGPTWGIVGEKCPDCLRMAAEGWTCPECGHYHRPRSDL